MLPVVVRVKVPFGRLIGRWWRAAARGSVEPWNQHGSGGGGSGWGWQAQGAGRGTYAPLLHSGVGGLAEAVHGAVRGLGAGALAGTGGQPAQGAGGGAGHLGDPGRDAAEAA
ncbi:hypothetical protein GCM10010446_28160 [Streptomyces enissocaesilis]|uniref:Uncharacterized protein n=1 Tax=Streptomyces enissocaesilis TaxID=332589 RepID=A0ABP6JPK5_9ACTN